MMGNKHLKVLFVTPWYPLRDRRHSGSFVQEFAETVHQEHSVTVLHALSYPSDLATRYQITQEEDIELSKDIPTYRLNYRWRFPKMIRLARSWYLFRALQKRLIQNGRPDVIHAHVHSVAFVCVLIGKLYKIPVVVSEHNSAFLLETLSRFDIIKAKFAFVNADAFLPVSNALRLAIEKYGIQRDFEIVPNIVDTNLFKPAHMLDSMNGAPDASSASKNSDLIKLLCVANMPESEVKGYRYLFDALARLNEVPKWHLDVIGDGPKRAHYEELVQELGLSQRVVFHGFQVKGDVARAMRQANIFVLASLWETMGCVLIEAMAAGLPIVATRTGGVPEIVTNDYGLLAKAGDPQSLSDTLAKMMNMYTQFSPLKSSQTAQQKYSREAIGRQLNRIYENVLTKSRVRN